jgi:hypothetical protein
MDFLISFHAMVASLSGFFFPKELIQIFFVNQTQCNSESFIFVFQALNLIVFAFSCSYFYAALYPPQRAVYITGFIGKMLIFVFFSYAYTKKIITLLAFIIGISDLFFALIYLNKILKEKKLKK